MPFGPGDIVRLVFNPSVTVTVMSKQNGKYRCKLNDFYNPDRCQDFDESEIEPVLKNRKPQNIFYNP